MRAVDVIEKKRRGIALSKEELQALITGYVEGSIPDYQMSAFLMAVVWRKMSKQELTDLTECMAASGDMLNLSEIPGIKVDKHSTGGVGDKTTLVLAPLLAAIGVPIAKMSGRGLGHTGGTIDKLEAIPGFQTGLTKAEFIQQVQSIGLAVAGQTGDLAPADKRIYALRDVTATVESIPLIASSVMSKKLASGADAIVLDVKVGDGAFMKTLQDAKQLAQTMVSIGESAKRRTVAVLSGMEEPLGNAVGNALEVREAIQTLRHQGPADLTELCLVLGSEMAVLAGCAPDAETARAQLVQALDDGSALAKFREFVKAQGGDPTVVEDQAVLPAAPVIRHLNAKQAGYVAALPALQFGEAAMRLGAGRAAKDDVINPAVGLVLAVKLGDRVTTGDMLVEIHAASEQAADDCARALERVIVLSETPVSRPPLILGQVRSGDDKDDDKQEAMLLDAAAAARARAYVPYSGFAVGAALRLSDGRVITGANIENASYGLTNCAERTAMFTALMQAGKKALQVDAVAVVADSPQPVSPCGACRQVLAEFCPPATPVLLGNLQGGTVRTTVGELLPGAFSSAQMSYTSAKTDLHHH